MDDRPTAKKPRLVGPSLNRECHCLYHLVAAHDCQLYNTSELGQDRKNHLKLCIGSAVLKGNLSKCSAMVQVTLYVVAVAIAFTCRPLRLSCQPWVYDKKL